MSRNSMRPTSLTWKPSANNWARNAIAFHLGRLPKEHLLKSLVPLYVGKTASFILEVDPMQQDEAEAEIEKLCMEFESSKDYLLTSWK